MVKGAMVIGACGSGKSTFARALATKLGCSYIEMDKHVWLDNNSARQESEWVASIQQEIDKSKFFVMDGATPWAVHFTEHFETVIIVDAPTEERVRRVNSREKASPEFLDFILHYEDNPTCSLMGIISSRIYDENFLKTLKCRVLRVDGTKPLEENIRLIY